MSLFKDRRDAGRQLASLLDSYKKADVIVLALPKGAVPIAYEVALALGVPLDVFVVRELRAPTNRDLVMGALASGGLIELHDEVVRAQGIDAEQIAAVAREETHELVRLEQAYRGGRPPSNVADMTVLLIDDGRTPEATLCAALRALRKGTPDSIVAAVPVAAPQACAVMLEEADALVRVTAPQPFTTVDDCYEDFGEPPADEVRELLATAWQTEETRTPEPADIRQEFTSSNRR